MKHEAYSNTINIDKHISIFVILEYVSSPTYIHNPRICLIPTRLDAFGTEEVITYTEQWTSTTQFYALKQDTNSRTRTGEKGEKNEMFQQIATVTDQLKQLL